MEIKRYTADFETCTWLEDETYVWAWALCEIGDSYNIRTGNNIDMFMNILEHKKNSYVYFHNLTLNLMVNLFYIIYYLMDLHLLKVVRKNLEPLIV